MTQDLLVFARYPEVGKCKTRLIPALGAQAAADLHEAMTRHTLNWARRLADRGSVRVLVHFSGGDVAAMNQRFGSDLTYVSQVQGDLGRKLRSAVAHSLEQGAQRVVVVGTDCPQLSASVAQLAFARLESHDACLAPASDGGYTLLGLSAECVAHDPASLDAVFDNIPWGTGEVLSATVAQLSQRRMTASLLPAMRDVDLPEDLAVARASLAGEAEPGAKLSVIIPTFGTEANLSAAIASAKTHAATEVIVVAAGDSSHSLAVAAEHQVQVLVAGACRALQLNLGSAQASSQTLVFLHADSLLPQEYAAHVLATLGEASTWAGGAFTLRIDAQGTLLRLVEQGVRLRSVLGQLPYGDQAIFVKRSVFEQLGGFREQAIMEDYEFIRRLRRKGRIKILPLKVTTSARRWRQRGALRTTCINQLMVLGYHAGISPRKLAAFYRRGQNWS